MTRDTFVIFVYIFFLFRLLLEYFVCTHLAKIKLRTFIHIKARIFWVEIFAIQYHTRTREH